MRTARHLELLNLDKPLRRYASSLQGDANASFLLVHEALAAAFAEPPEHRREGSLEASLRRDIHQSFAAGQRVDA